MKALGTNVLARFFVDDPDDVQAARQRPAAVAALAERAFVPVTVLLELEWVLRGFYELPARDVSRVLRALAGIAQAPEQLLWRAMRSPGPPASSL